MTGLMKETEEIAAQRKQLREMHDLLHKANEILNEVLINSSIYSSSLLIFMS